MKNYKFIICIIGIAALSGCAGWSKKKCESMNWEQMGYSEGSSGKTNNSNAYAATCSKKGAMIDVNQYNAGYNKGIKIFCSYDAGKGVGANNSPLNKTCQKFDEYMKGYSAGLKIFCSADNGYSTAIEGQDPVNKCMRYSVYSTAYKKGSRDFCSEKNGKRLGEKGLPFPEKCERAGKAFERSFNRGRLGFLEDKVKETDMKLSSDRRSYERLRDDLNDMQFELGRMPRYTSDQVLLDRKRSLDEQIARTRDQRDQLRGEVERTEREVRDMRDEISYLRKRI